MINIDVFNSHSRKINKNLLFIRFKYAIINWFEKKMKGSVTLGKSIWKESMAYS